MMNLWYRYGTPPWIMGPRDELVKMVESGRLKPGRAIDLGCGAGDNSVYLAKHGFDVTGVDFAESAIERAKKNAEDNGVDVNFVVGDLTDLQGIEGPFDVLVDYGTYDDLNDKLRRRYLENVLPLMHRDSVFLMYCFEWNARWWEKAIGAAFGGVGGMIPPGHIDECFGPRFSIERISHWENPGGFIQATSAYLMTNRGDGLGLAAK
jgi:cyclopropane fatty-acyl-phospholipid synthase-like methyltransferase